MSSALWEQLIGQETALDSLRQTLASNRLASGYLFRGPGQVGKATAARGLAQALRCATAPGRGCGACRECRLIAEGKHSEVHLVAADVVAGRQAFRPKIHRVETIRRLLDELQLRVADSGWRVIILDDADALNAESGNTLLKTLEEPPARTLFVLVTAQPARMLPTITSRLQRVDFGLAATALIEEWLQTAHGVGRQQAALLARLAAGRPGRALAWSRDEEIQRQRRDVLKIAARLGAEPVAAALAHAQWLNGPGGEDAGPSDRVAWCIECLEWWYRDALVLAGGGAEAALANRDLLADLRPFSARYGPVACRAALEALAEARLSLSRNGNALLVLEVLWLRLARGTRALGTHDAD